MIVQMILMNNEVETFEDVEEISITNKHIHDYKAKDIKNIEIAPNYRELPMANLEELEQKLLNDPTFQHILKFAPESQRELMTYELARYIYRLMEGK